jgi:hypothetical protein
MSAGGATHLYLHDHEMRDQERAAWRSACFELLHHLQHLQWGCIVVLTIHIAESYPVSLVTEKGALSHIMCGYTRIKTIAGSRMTRICSPPIDA